MGENGSTPVAPREYPGLNDPLTDAILLVCALLTILATLRAWKARPRFGIVQQTSLPKNGAESVNGTEDTNKDRGLVSFREIKSFMDAWKWTGAMFWRFWVLVFLLGAILATGIYGSLLTWWYFGGP